MSKRCKLQKEYYQQYGNYKGNGKYKDEYVNWLEEQILALRIHSVMQAEVSDVSEGAAVGQRSVDTKPAGGYCKCEFVMIMRNQETQIGYCAQCEKEVNEQ